MPQFTCVSMAQVHLRVCDSQVSLVPAVSEPQTSRKTLLALCILGIWGCGPLGLCGAVGLCRWGAVWLWQRATAGVWGRRGGAGAVRLCPPPPHLSKLRKLPN